MLHRLSVDYARACQTLPRREWSQWPPILLSIDMALWLEAPESASRGHPLRSDLGAVRNILIDVDEAQAIFRVIVARTQKILGS